jgi:flagellar M-ring protein FliF
MSTALTTTPQLPERFANPLRQIGGLLAQPAVRRSLPMVLMIGLIGAAALAWMMLATPTQKILFAGLPDADKASVTAALSAGNIPSKVDDSGNVTVAEDNFARAKMLLASQNLPKSAPGGYAILDNLPMGVSRAVEGERLRQARETEIAKSIEDIDAVAEARVHLATPEASVFVRDNAAPSASVIVKLQPGRSLSDAQVRSIVNLVASSVPGMKPDAVTIVDQMGSLLSKSADGSGGASVGDQRIDFQRRIEDKYRTQLIQLLTPLVGAGNFSAEVQADVNLDETQATRESYDKAGTLRAEQGNWTGNQKDGATPGGIPGALSNTPPPATTLTPNGQKPGVGPLPTPPVPGAPAGADVVKQSDQFARAYDLGKEVSVTRAAPGGIRRLSVAVLLRDPEKGGRRTALEIQQITDLVKAAVGADASRNDLVTVISKKFADTDVSAASGQKWYDAGWLPVVARNGTALVIALLVLFLGVRPLSKALMKKREDATDRPVFGEGAMPMSGEIGAAAPEAPVSIDQLSDARGFDSRVGAVRGFTRDNPARAALAVRDMIKS